MAETNFTMLVEEGRVEAEKQYNDTIAEQRGIAERTYQETVDRERANAEKVFLEQVMATMLSKWTALRNLLPLKTFVILMTLMTRKTFLQVAMGRADAEKQFQEAIEEGREGKYILVYFTL